MTERMSNEEFEILKVNHDYDDITPCNAGWLIAERAKVHELKAELAVLRERLEAISTKEENADEHTRFVADSLYSAGWNACLAEVKAALQEPENE